MPLILMDTVSHPFIFNSPLKIKNWKGIIIKYSFYLFIIKKEIEK